MTSCTVDGLKDEGIDRRVEIGANNHSEFRSSRPILLWRGYARSHDLVLNNYAGASETEAMPGRERRPASSAARGQVQQEGRSLRPSARLQACNALRALPGVAVRHRPFGSRPSERPYCDEAPTRLQRAFVRVHRSTYFDWAIS